MSTPVSTAAISGNILSGSSVQFNIVACDGVNFQELVKSFEHLAFQHAPKPQGDTVNGELEGQMKDLTLLESSTGEQDSKIAGDYWCTICNNCFYELRGFEKLFEACLRRYSRSNRAPVIECLSQSHTQKDTLQSWLTEPELITLCAYGRLNTGPSNWTSEVALEILRMAQTVVHRTEPPNLAALYHFCGEIDYGVVSTPEIIIQDLISQVIGSRPERFERKVCQQHRLSEARFAEARTRFDDLWELFSDCLSISGIQSLLIVLDNVDVLISGDQRNEQEMDIFRRLLEKLSHPNYQGKVLFKVLMTSRSPEVSRYLPVQAVGQARIALLKVSVPPVWNRMFPSPEANRVDRVPIADDASDSSDSSYGSDSSQEDEDEAFEWWTNSTYRSEEDNYFESKGEQDEIYSTKPEVKAATPRDSALSVVEVDSDYIPSDDSLEDDSEGDDVG